MPRSAKKLSPQPNPAIRLSNLRQRLDQVLVNQSAPTHTMTEVDRLTDGLKPTAFLPLLTGAFAAAPPEATRPLDEPLAAWLQRRGYIEPLRDLAVRGALNIEARDLALRWLETAGVATADLAVPEADVFYGAYSTGNTFQGSLGIFWYPGTQRRRIRGLSFLIDFEPPWDGSLKDVAVMPLRTPDDQIEDYLNLWRRQVGEPQPLTADEARDHLMTAVEHSRTQGISLPADMVSARDIFLSMMRSLPTDDSAPFGAAEFDTLAHVGRRPEDLRMMEQIGGYQTRMGDGKVMRILRMDDEEDEGDLRF